MAGRVILAGETIITKHWVKHLAFLVLFEDVFKEVVKYNAGDPSFVIVVKVGPQPILFRLAQSM